MDIKKVVIRGAFLSLILTWNCLPVSNSSTAGSSLCRTPNNDLNASNQCLLVGTTDYMTANLVEIDLARENVITRNLLDGLDQDHVLRKIGEEVYVLSRGNSNITRLDPLASNTNYPIIYEKSTGENSNPQDIALLNDDLGLVSLYNEGHLAVFQRENGNISKTINISTYDSDGIPNATALHEHGDYVYLAMQVLDQNYEGRSNGKLVSISKSDETLSNLSNMPFKNPNSDFHYYSGKLNTSTIKDWLIITAVASYTDTTDAGVMAYDIANNSWKTILSESTVSANIFDAVVITDTLGLALISLADYSNKIVKFNPNNATVNQSDLNMAVASGNFSSMLYDDGKLYLAQASIEGEGQNTGIRIFNVDTSTGAITEDTVNNLGSTPINTGLPPDTMILINR